MIRWLDFLWKGSINYWIVLGVTPVRFFQPVVGSVLTAICPSTTVSGILIIIYRDFLQIVFCVTVWSAGREPSSITLSSRFWGYIKLYFAAAVIRITGIPVLLRIVLPAICRIILEPEILTIPDTPFPPTARFAMGTALWIGMKPMSTMTVSGRCGELTGGRIVSNVIE
jgi:hypothetical protein